MGVAGGVAEHPDPNSRPGGYDDQAKRALERRAARKDYTEQEIEAGLLALAYHKGNRRAAADAVKKELGVEIPDTTLRDWARSTHAARYVRIRDEVIPKILAEQRDEFSALISKQNELEGALTDRLSLQLGELEPGETATALRNVATSKAINYDKLALADGRPTQRTEHRDVGEIIKALKSKGVDVIEGTAEEIPPDA